MEIQTSEEAAAEMLDILKHTGIEYVRKIPPDFISLLEKKASKTYTPTLDYTKKLKDMNLKPKTRALISIIYREYFCDEVQRKAYDKKLREEDWKYQRELEEKYSKDKLFQNKKFEKKKSVSSKEIMLTKSKNETFFRKILNKIFTI